MFVKNCISLLNQHQREVEDDISSKSASDLDSSLTFSLLEFEREALISVKKLFIMVSYIIVFLIIHRLCEVQMLTISVFFVGYKP